MKQSRSRARSRATWLSAKCLLAASLLAALSPAQETRRHSVPAFPEGSEPSVDGVFEKGIWGKIPVIGQFTTVLPVEGERPSRRTRVRIARSKKALYLAIECFDEPELVRGHLMARDANLDPDDRVEFWFDTFHDRRFAYWFQIGAGGSKGDALIAEGGTRFNKSWDGIWKGKARRVAKGWVAEVALPFQTLSFSDENSVWGFNVRRLRKEDNSEARWANAVRSQRFFNPALGGVLTNMRGMDQGIGIDVSPYLKFGSKRDRRVRKHRPTTGDMGLDLRYRLSPSLGLVLTFNTDFAETEVDTRQVNLTRFPLFFPEKRDFFLADAGLFEFGSSKVSRSMIPFFSRRIGRDANGRPIPIEVGGKLVGRVADWNIGALGTLLDEHGQDPRKSFGVLRVSRNLGKENSIGMIASTGKPEGPGTSATYGVDFRLGDSNALGPGKSLQSSGYYVRSQASDASGRGAAYGVQLDFRSDTIDWDSGVHVVEKGFRPELGFVRRRDVRQYRSSFEYSAWIESDLLRSLQFRVSPTLTTLDSSEIDSWALPMQYLEARFESGDRIELEVHRIHERLKNPFEIYSGVQVAAGKYTMTRHFADFRFSDRRSVAGDLEFQYGEFYDGRVFSFELQPELIVSDNWQLGASYSEYRVRLAGGRFTTRLWSARLDLIFSPDVTLKNFVQYDSESKELSWQSRFRWILEPGTDLYFVAIHGWERNRYQGPLVPTTQDLTIKAVYTLRF